MPLKNFEQPEIIQISDTLRLKRYDGCWEKMLPGYQTPYVYQNSEGIFDDSKKPDEKYIQGMCRYLESVGEFYFIEVEENDSYISIGDITIKPENPPIAIWDARHRGCGFGKLVMQAAIDRLRELRFEKITGSGVYKWNVVSQKMHEKLGFKRVNETEDSYIYELTLK